MPSANNITGREWRSLSQTGAAVLNDRQRRALAVLLSSGSVSEAARRCGVSRRTLVRWMADPAFRAAYSAASRTRFDDAVDELRAGALQAVGVLRAALSDPSPRERVRAAVAMLGLLPKIDPASQNGITREPPPIETKRLIFVGGTEEEYVAALRRICAADGELDEDVTDIPADQNAILTPFDPLARYGKRETRPGDRGSGTA